jgi:tetratricopeptide (TPR) repeat protein
MGDLAAAVRLAEKAGDNELLGGLLDEKQDFQALARLAPGDILNSPARVATVEHHAGHREGFEAAVSRIPPADHWSRARVYFFNDRPRAAIEAERQVPNTAGVCKLLALQGRRHDALALAAQVDSRPNASQRVQLLLELAVLSQQMGEKDKARGFVVQAVQGIEKAMPHEVDHLLAAVFRAGLRMNQRKEAHEDVDRLLDRLKPKATPSALLHALSERNGDALVAWWEFLRRKSPDTPPSTTFARLRTWFEQGKTDKEFDALLTEATPAKTATPAEQDRWYSVLARTAQAVGKPKKAEEILRAGAQAANSATASERLGDFYFERKQWKEAAAEYEKVLARDQTAILAGYLRGVALGRLGQVKEGQVLRDRARLLALADEASRYSLADGLARRGLDEEAAAEQLLMVRTGRFRSIYAANAASRLASRAARKKQHLEAARYYRRLYLTLALRGGSFLDDTAYLRVPAWVHLHQARGLIAAGKLDDALQESKVFLDYLPEETTLVIELVRALDRAKRKEDADRLFERIFAEHQRACEGAPKSVDCHNRLAWFLVRCGRQLDRALRHAKTATTLAPEAAGCLDTLAEVHFQRGEQTEALAAMKRAVKLAKSQPYYLAQLRRMEAGNRDADVPER